MNIFYLHNDPQIAAQMHCDKHVVKMILEYAQLLSTAHHELDGVPSIECYKNVFWRVGTGNKLKKKNSKVSTFGEVFLTRPGLSKMLVGPRAIAVPGIIREG